jgi:hypothetical protein
MFKKTRSLIEVTSGRVSSSAVLSLGSEVQAVSNAKSDYAFKKNPDRHRGESSSRESSHCSPSGCQKKRLLCTQIATGRKHVAAFRRGRPWR